MKELHLAEGTVRHEKRVAVGTLFWKVGCMTIEKVINNNIVSAFDEIGREVVSWDAGSVLEADREQRSLKIR